LHMAAVSNEVAHVGTGNKLETAFARLENDGIEIGIRERVIAARIVAELFVEPRAKTSGNRSTFLLRARLTPLLAKSTEDVEHIHRAFRDVFDRGTTEPATPPETRPLRIEEVLRAERRVRRSYYAIASGAALVIALLAGINLYPRLVGPATIVTQEALDRATTTGESTVTASPTVTTSTNGPLTTDELGQIAQQITKMTGGKRTVSLTELAVQISGFDPAGTKTRGAISLLERYLSRPPNQQFALTEVDFANLIAVLATRRYPGRSAPPSAIAAAVAVSGLNALSAEQNRLSAELPAPAESLFVSPRTTAFLLALPAIPFGVWLLGRRRRLKDYLRRRMTDRRPLIHELLVRAPIDVMREQTMLTRAAIRLGRARQGVSREIDAEATVAAIAHNAGRPQVVFASARVTPEYLVLISTKGDEDHLARQLDRVVAELAGQYLSIVRFFMAHDANLCFDELGSNYFNLDRLAARYPDHRLMFLGSGDQLLNPGTLEVWPWAEDLTSWKRRAILTPKPIEEWGQREASLARLFDGPPLRANSAGMLQLAEFFERQEDIGSDSFTTGCDPVRRTWTFRPQRWLNPLPPDDRAFKQLETELESYFTDDHGHFDQAAFWWFGACAIYPVLRWDLTIYLGLKLTMPQIKIAGGMPLYTEERALRLAVLPWFREGYMPDWLRRRLLESLPKSVRVQATALLRDLLERAVNSDGQTFDSVRLRIAQDRPDPAAAQPERDEIFLDTLARQDSLAFEAPRSFRQLVSRRTNAFVAREWATFSVLVIYWLGVALLVPWRSSGALATGALLPLMLLPLGLLTWPIADRIVQRVGTRREDTARAGIENATDDRI
jgi:hypothetical protein